MSPVPHDYTAKDITVLEGLEPVRKRPGMYIGGVGATGPDHLVWGAGGKVEHLTYKTAGGLHGVGASVVNALSKELVATSKRDGASWEQRFKQGQPSGAPKKTSPARGT